MKLKKNTSIVISRRNPKLFILFMSVGILVVFAAISVMYFSTGSFKMVLPFKQVQSFSRADEFYNSFLGYKGLASILKGGNIADNAGDFKSSSIYHIIDSEGKFYYIWRDDKLIKYSRAGEKLQTVTTSDCNLNPEEYKYGEILGISNDNLWFRLDHLIKTGENRNDNILQLSLDSSPVRCVFHAVDDYDTVAFDPLKQQFFLTSFDYISKVSTIKVFGLVDGKLTKVKEKVINEGYSFYCSDYNIRGGLLLSRYVWNKRDSYGLPADGPEILVEYVTGKDPVIAVLDPNLATYKKIDEGVCAKWGDDGYIYFVRGHTQLWRYNTKTDKTEPVYFCTRFPKGNNGYDESLRFGKDHSFLIFYYMVPISEKAFKTGFVLIDLKTKEYNNIPTGKTLQTTDFR